MKRGFKLKWCLNIEYLMLIDITYLYKTSLWKRVYSSMFILQNLNWLIEAENCPNRIYILDKCSFWLGYNKKMYILFWFFQVSIFIKIHLLVLNTSKHFIHSIMSKNKWMYVYVSHIYETSSNWIINCLNIGAYF